MKHKNFILCILLVFFLYPKFAAAQTFYNIDFSRNCIIDTNANFGGLYEMLPRGEVEFKGIPFYIPATGPDHWNSHDGCGIGPNPRFLDIQLNEYGADKVYTLINTIGGQPGGPYAWLEFWGDQGAYFRKDLFGNVDIRDLKLDGWTNYINNTTTVNVFLVNPGIYNSEARLDMQQIDLPEEFLNQSLAEIRLTDIGDSNFQRVFLTGIAVSISSFTACGLPDTGQTQSYTDTFGEDSDYSYNPHSYTDLGNGIVRDNVTGLEWQQATAFGTYTWEQALTYCEGLTLAEYSDWRLPTIKELSTLVDSGIPNPGPTINLSYFPDTVGGGVESVGFESYYWSSTTDASDSGRAYGVHFNTGTVGDAGYNKNYDRYYVRAVRGGQTNNNLIENGDGTISDTSTGLMWQQATAFGTYTWEQALTYCEGLTLAEYSDWRLPNRNELQSIVDYSTYAPAIDTTFFPDTGTTVESLYWTSTTAAGEGGTNVAWIVYFHLGGLYGFGNVYGPGPLKSNSYYVRAVRGGQCGPTTVITLSSFIAQAKSEQVIIEWKTESEIDNTGFNLYRAESKVSQYTKINTSLIPAQGSSTQGANYEFIDNDVKNRKTYYYKLEDIDLNGISTMYGPESATPRLIYGMGK